MNSLGLEFLPKLIQPETHVLKKFEGGDTHLVGVLVVKLL